MLSPTLLVLLVVLLSTIPGAASVPVSSQEGRGREFPSERPPTHDTEGRGRRQFTETEEGVIRRRDDIIESRGKSSSDPGNDVTSTFRVERLDAPMETIEIRLIDENTTAHSEDYFHTQTFEETTTNAGEGGEIQNQNRPEDVKEERTEDVAAYEESISTTARSMEPYGNSVNKYRKVEYAAEAPIDAELTTTEATSTTENAVASENAEERAPEFTQGDSPNSEFTTNAPLNAYVERMPVSTPIPTGQLESVSYYDTQQQSSLLPLTTLPPAPKEIDDLATFIPPDVKETMGVEETEPVEECLTNKELLPKETVEGLLATAHRLGKKIRKLNRQQAEFCFGRDQGKATYRQCPVWRDEKMVHYYKLMRITYCSDMDAWPNAPRLKRAYAQHLQLFETLYAFSLE